jgi:hypothetical protein
MRLWALFFTLAACFAVDYAVWACTAVLCSEGSISARSAQFWSLFVLTFVGAPVRFQKLALQIKSIGRKFAAYFCLTYQID